MSVHLYSLFFSLTALSSFRVTGKSTITDEMCESTDNLLIAGGNVCVLVTSVSSISAVE